MVVKLASLTQKGLLNGSRLGWLEGQLLGRMLGLDAGSEKCWDGADDWNNGWKEGSSESFLDGYKEGWLDGCLDYCKDRLSVLEITMLGRLLGWDNGLLNKFFREDGSDVGLSATGGCVGGYTLGISYNERLINGLSFGWDDGCKGVFPNLLVLPFNCDVSQSKTRGG